MQNTEMDLHMNKLLQNSKYRILSLSLVLSTLLMTTSGYAELVNTPVVPANLPEKMAEQTMPALPVVSYKNLPNARGSVVYINDAQVAWFINPANNSLAELRAKDLTLKLQKIIRSEIDPNKILPVRENGKVLVKANDEIVLKIDYTSAKAFGMPAYELANKWANEARTALGAQEVPATLVLKDIPKPTFVQQGLASWYGGNFHGRRTSSGARFDTYALTAAHRKLPFNSLVKVTNLRNNKSCVVRINDRGPFVDRRIIDLSKAAASQIGMLSSGVSPVKIEVIGKVASR